MKKALLTAAAAATLAAPAMAEVEYELGVGYTSEYVFRGLDLGNDLVDISLSAAFEAGGFDITVGAWYADFNVPITGANQVESDELDLYISAGKDVSIFGIDGTVELGFTQYLYQNSSASNTNEVALGLSTEYAGFDLGLYYVYDLDLIEEAYLEATIGKSLPINSCISADIELGAAYSFEYNSTTDELNHLWASVAFPYAFKENATLTPFATFISAQDAIEPAQDDELIGGVNLTVAF